MIIVIQSEFGGNAQEIRKGARFYMCDS